jgi:hypothetical protein
MGVIGFSTTSMFGLANDPDRCDLEVYENVESSAIAARRAVQRSYSSERERS